MKRLFLISVLFGSAGLYAATGTDARPNDLPDTPSASTDPGTGSNTITILDDAVSVDLIEIPMSEVLNEFSRQSGIRIRSSSGLASLYITDRFEDLPVDDALLRLLKGSSYVIIRDGAGGNGRISEAYVLGPDTASGRVTGNRDIGISSMDEVMKSIDTSALPDDIKRSLRDTYAANAAARGQDLTEIRQQAISRLIEALESAGAADSEVTGDLRRQLQQPVSEP